MYMECAVALQIDFRLSGIYNRVDTAIGRTSLLIFSNPPIDDEKFGHDVDIAINTQSIP